MKNNLIQWPRAQYWDKPWNPIVGCRPCSPACEFGRRKMNSQAAVEFNRRKFGWKPRKRKEPVEE